MVGDQFQNSRFTPNNFTAPVIYTVTAENGAAADYTVTVNIELSSAKLITGFSLGAAIGTINEGLKTIAVTMQYGTDVTALVATFTTTGANVKVSAAAQTSGTTPNDFTAPVTYTVTAADSTTVDYVVTVNVAGSSAKEITGFSLDTVGGIINEGAKTIAVTMPPGTNLTVLVATFSTTGANVKVGAAVQTSGTTANNFTSPVVYTVTAAGGITVDYTVTVTISASSVNLPKTGQTTSYATGDDGNLDKGIAWPASRFTYGTGAEDGDCITDNLTGLMWVPSGGVIRSWDGALFYSNNLTACGFSDWRLPNRKELRSLINYGESNNVTWLNSQGFSNVSDASYWTSTSYAASANSAWLVRGCLWRRRGAFRRSL
jgi:hypothetical protein